MTKMHLERPQPPWRLNQEGYTLCGRPVTETPNVARYWRASDEAQCKTCLKRGSCWTEWSRNPCVMLLRELERVEYGRPEEVILLRRELKALADLAVLHRREFDQLLAGETPQSLLVLEQEYDLRRQEIMAVADLENPAQCDE